jgi:hypothetical protein
MSGPLQQAAGIAELSGSRGTRSTTVFTTVGHVTYSRAYVKGTDGKWSFPADEALGLVEKCTPLGARLLCHEAARSQSYLQAEENLKIAAGLSVSASTIHRLVRVIGPDIENWAHLRNPEKPRQLRDVIVVLQTDMTGVRMLKKYLKKVKGKNGEPTCRQIKCGTVFLMQKDSKGEYQRISDSAVHVLSFSDPTSFSASLHEALLKLGVPFDTRMIVVSDGAEWIWNMVKDRFQNAIQIVDFWHAAENLNKLCQLIYGEGSQAQAAFRLWRRKMKRYGINCVIRGIQEIAEGSQKKREILKGLEYFKKHRDRMKYASYRKHGWPIGSGVIEGACKSLIKQRTGLSGQRWSPDGALDILWIRAAIIDGLHDKYWNEKRKRPRKKRKTNDAA